MTSRKIVSIVILLVLASLILFAVAQVTPYDFEQTSVFHSETSSNSIQAPSFAWKQIPGSIYWAKDENYVYFRADLADKYRVLQGADPATFVFVGGLLAKDKNQIYSAYIDGQVVSTTADVVTFESLNNGEHFKDKDKVYYPFDGFSLEELVGADPHTFTVLKACEIGPELVSYYGKDRSGVY